ncbi:hypothetical protein [Shewanella spartinae]|uniref:hypothetical protein n=1 Tax=Shewanella spartinae TaxID=2864205 RepID=UPI001C65DC74|nr:hypothetical protein [Shewanella spartinae]QYJ94384.1 hypothetical protein K0I31_03060 [Shewanella spartinae]
MNIKDRIQTLERNPYFKIIVGGVYILGGTFFFHETMFYNIPCKEPAILFRFLCSLSAALISLSFGALIPGSIKQFIALKKGNVESDLIEYLVTVQLLLFGLGLSLILCIWYF